MARTKACVVCGRRGAARCDEHALLAHPRGNAFQATRIAVAERDNWTCQEPTCGTRLTEAILEIDHIVPRARGGTDHPSNLRALCRPCNRRKGDR